MSLLRVENLKKSFPGVLALKGINLDIRAGEIHALMGENGAGKSTFIKVLTGIYEKDEGHIFLDGKEVVFKNPLEANKQGISTVYQELNLIPFQTVYENLFLGKELGKSFFLDRKKMQEESRKILLKLGLDIDVCQPLKNYSTAIQQMIAIARAVNMKAKLLILDEPTSSLDKKEVSVLFDIMRKLRAEGLGIIFISHKLDEIYEITDRLSILKDGEFVSCHKTSEISQLELVMKMIGQETKGLSREKDAYSFLEAEELVKMTNISYQNKLQGINLDIKKGEVVGLAGLLGSGRSEIAKVLFSVFKHQKGKILWLGEEKILHKPQNAIKLGMGFCSEDRKIEGIMPHLSVKENLTMALLPQISKYGFVDAKKQKELAEKYVRLLNIKTASLDVQIKTLSGGNQQKVLLARWMCMNPSLIILDEPTRGIDIGAKAEVEKVISNLAKEGVAILIISSELAELERNCDRIFVVRDGRINGSLYGDDIKETSILNLIAAKQGGEDEK